MKDDREEETKGPQRLSQTSEQLFGRKVARAPCSDRLLLSVLVFGTLLRSFGDCVGVRSFIIVGSSAP